MSSSKICMNGLCGVTTTTQWKRGWSMKAGGFATLCYSCGTAYDTLNYCERFHLNEPGWRECKFCDKPIHCGCVVSRNFHECLDLGGISCRKCIKATGTQPLKTIQSYPSEFPNSITPFSGTWLPSVIGNRIVSGASLNNGKLTPLTKSLEKSQLSPSTSSIGHHTKQDETRLSYGEFGVGFSSNKDFGTLFSNSTSLFATPNNNKTNIGTKTLYEGMPQQSLGISLVNALSTSKSPVKEAVKVASFKQGQRSRITVPKVSKSGVNTENRGARRPAEGRGSNHLLPRYWPKITDQELLKISGDLNSNCTITPLFEKVLSASDAGRIGRLVLPKACAEAYFPPINQSEGLPIRIQDIKGKEWTFQFRFWPNNNSRMYVLEGVTPCIQNMQLQAGDTVIFSRIDPEDKLVIGCRKATIDTQEAETSAIPNGVPAATSSSGGNENQPTNESMNNGDSMQRPASSEKKKSRNIGSKSKRLLMHSEDAMELKVTWEEAQEFLRPSSTSKPTVVTIENCDFEEFEDPPVFGKKTIFTMHTSGSQEQWGQCDSCSKWRKLPSDVLLPPKWTCSDNVWDQDRCSCSAPDEINTRDLERIFKFGKESKKRKLAPAQTAIEHRDQEPCGLDALATAAVLGEIGSDASVGPTTRHPRHRPGCTCIVCIQPPSGKGKHKPNCICNVCLTVKRRFKTLMLRKKKRVADKVAQKSQLDLNCDPIEAVSMDVSTIASAWPNVLSGLVPCTLNEGTSETDGHNSPTKESTSPLDEQKEV